MNRSWQRMFPNEKVDTMLQSAYSLKGSSERSVSLYDGLMVVASGAEQYGTIDLIFDGTKPWIRWSVAPTPLAHPTLGKTFDLTLTRHQRKWSATAHAASSNGGWIDHADFVIPRARLKRVIVNWINLPNIFASGRIEIDEPDGRSHCWAGRWQIDVGDWRLTLDRHHDYNDTTNGADATPIFTFTHVMEFRRADGGEFDADAANQMLEYMRVCMSFAFGRWVAPALPVGYDEDDRVAWESWASPICDPMKEVGSAWLYRLRSDDLTELFKRALPAFMDPQRPGITRFQMILAVQAVETGFVEQRILAIFSALENLEWSGLVLGNLVSSRDYKDSRGEDRLRQILELAHIQTNIDTVNLPSLADFAAKEKLSDGPAAVVNLRNRLVHPKRINDQIYQFDGLMCDAWLLSRHYLNLLILHSIGYRGSYVRLLPPFGWAGDAEPVPWVATEESDSSD